MRRRAVRSVPLGKRITGLFLSVTLSMAASCGSNPTPTVRTTLPPSTPTLPPPTSTLTPTLAPTPIPTIKPTQATPQSFSLDLQPLVSSLEQPTYLTDPGDGSGRLFVTEQPGRIRIIANGQLLDQPFLDVADLVSTSGNERGLFSIAFSPDFKSNGQFFIDYTREPDGATIIARYTVSAKDPNVADLNSAVTILEIDQPQANHNGGQLQFGPDSYLYIGMGDGGGQGDRHGTIGNGQDLSVLLGKLLRINVTGVDTYSIPASNPFANKSGARPEIWAYGLRNPWRFSFDRTTSDLYIADVGQNTYEEIDFQAASDPGGENYGWRIMEGLHCFSPQAGCDQSGLTMPIAEYTHDDGCSITGGYVYRGAAYPAMQGAYFFADYCSGIIWSLQRDASGAWQMTQQLDSGLLVSSFGEDQAGELYVIDHGGAVYRLTAK